MAVSIPICNLALGDVRAPAIADIGEDSNEAKLCQRYYPNALQQLLDFTDWGFALKLATLAQLTANDRSSEWAYAYTLPVDCLRPVRLVPSGVYAVPCFYDRPPVPGWWHLFIVADGVLYCNDPAAVLEYSTNDVSESVMSPAFKQALRYLLAADLAMSLRDSRDMKGDFIKQADVAMQRAIAIDRNRQPSLDVTDEVGWARRG